jgi:hypothetical protein
VRASGCSPFLRLHSSRDSTARTAAADLPSAVASGGPSAALSFALPPSHPMLIQLAAVDSTSPDTLQNRLFSPVGIFLFALPPRDSE